MQLADKSRAIASARRPETAVALAGLLLLSPLVVLANPIEARLVKAFAGSLENRIARPLMAEKTRLDGIIVLGGSPTRVEAALMLAKRFPGASFVLSGPGDTEIALAQKEIGRDPRLVIDRRATTTYENALFSKDLVAPRAGQCWAVVTSSVHMPRAIGAFEAVRFPVLPLPVADTPTEPAGLSTWVWHEVLGLIWYWVLGRSSSLYPSGGQACQPADATAA